MGSPEGDAWRRRFLAEEAEAQTRILATLRGRLERGMAKADPNNTDPPTREWVRAARLYFDGYKTLAMLEIEAAKLRLAAHRVGFEQLSDEDMERGLAELGREQLDAMPVEELEAALARRRQERALEAGDPGGESP